LSSLPLSFLLQESPKEPFGGWFNLLQEHLHHLVHFFHFNSSISIFFVSVCVKSFLSLIGSVQSFYHTLQVQVQFQGAKHEEASSIIWCHELWSLRDKFLIRSLNFLAFSYCILLFLHVFNFCTDYVLLFLSLNGSNKFNLLEPSKKHVFRCSMVCVISIYGF